LTKRLRRTRHSSLGTLRLPLLLVHLSEPRQKILAGLDPQAQQPGQDFFTLVSLAPGPISPRTPGTRAAESLLTPLPEDLRLESLEVGATPLVQHFLRRLDLLRLFQSHLPARPGRVPAVPSATVLCLLVSNLLVARQPLYALPEWATRRVPEHFGLTPEQTTLLNDDRIGGALDHLQQVDRASLLTVLVRHVVTEFAIDLQQFHQDTTTVTFSGDYADQAPAEQSDRPPRITCGYNKDHRPDLKQLLFSITLCDDGAVPLHAKTYDGNTTDDQVHQETWSFLRQLVGHSNFLYVADCKLCTRENMSFIAGQHGRFLTVMPRTRREDEWFRDYVPDHEMAWPEVHREPNPRRRDGPDVVYHALESPQGSSEGYRVLWYRSSQKAEQDRRTRQGRLERTRARLEAMQAPGRRQEFHSNAEARAAAERIVAEGQGERWLRIVIEEEVEEAYRQIGPGRPGPNTEYRRIEHVRYRIRWEENTEALTREACCDGLFPLMTNDTTLALGEALRKYKYQPFVEKRHEQLKGMFAVAPMWLKNVGRVESLLWLYYVVELVGALIEREVRQRMAAEGWESLALYPEGRASEEPTTASVFRVLEGHRRHRLLDGQGQELRRFHDPLSVAARQVLDLLGVDGAAYGPD
jgi:transposase